MTTKLEKQKCRHGIASELPCITCERAKRMARKRREAWEKIQAKAKELDW
jgi:hypothetical protein